MKKALLIDYKYCDQCNSCVVACKNEKGLQGEEWGIKIKEIGPELIGDKFMRKPCCRREKACMRASLPFGMHGACLL